MDGMKGSMASYIDPGNICSQLSTSDPMYVCAGCNITSATWEQQWIGLNCPLFFSSMIYDKGRYSESGLNEAQSYANNLLQSYSLLYDITDPGNSGYNNFQEILHRFCNNSTLNPGICQNYLEFKECVGIDYETMTESQVEWCGCFVYPPNADIYGDNVACYPTCHLIDTIQTVDENSGIPLSCDNQVCVIDDVSIRVVSSKVGPVTINSICPGCDGSCTCIIDNVDVEGTDLNVNQYCGDNTYCYQTIDGSTQEVECPTYEASIDINWLIVSAIAFVILVILIIIILLVVLAKNR